jgi:hypothetical protein
MGREGEGLRSRGGAEVELREICWWAAHGLGRALPHAHHEVNAVGLNGAVHTCKRSCILPITSDPASAPSCCCSEIPSCCCIEAEDSSGCEIEVVFAAGASRAPRGSIGESDQLEMVRL